MNIRPATPTDYDRIIRVVDDWWAREVHHILPRLFLDHFHRTSPIAETGDELAAFLVGFLSPSSPDTAYIHFVGVNPAFRGTGLARRLYETFFAQARADGRTTVRALTSPQNTGSIAFHKAMGFTSPPRRPTMAPHRTRSSSTAIWPRDPDMATTSGGLPPWTSELESLTLTEAAYDALPDEARKLIEVINGNVILSQRGASEHSDVARRLANRLQETKSEARVSTSIDVHYLKRRRKDRKFSFRRPDVSVYKCVPRGAKLTAADTVMVVEVVSPGSGYTDTVDKLAEYAHEGIPVYLVVFLDGDLYVKTVHEYRLDWGSRSYRLVGTHEDELVLEEPFGVTVPFAELDG